MTNFNNQHDQVLRVLLRRPATDYEISRAYPYANFPYSSVQRPRGQLEKWGYVERTEEMRKSDLGGSGRVRRLTAAGREVAVSRELEPR